MDITEALITAIIFVLTLCFLFFFFRLTKHGERTSRVHLSVHQGENSKEILPDDVIAHIFSSLPAKSVARCRCVSKYWCDKLKDPNFINMHLQQCIISERFNCFSINDASEFYLHISKSSSLSVFEDDYREEPVEMDSPHKSQVFQSRHIQCYDSLNGLILMRSINFATKEEVLCLWNPTTKELKDIKVPKVDSYHSFDGPAYGFGYKSGIDDYIIVKANNVCFYDGSLGYEVCTGCAVQMYALRSDSWRRLPDNIPYRIVSPKAAVSTNDGVFLHWIAEQTPCQTDSLGREVVVSFDIFDENFREVPLSPQVDGLVCNTNNKTTLGVLAGCLCITHFGDYNIEVWTMKDYNVKDSWTKLLVAELPIERHLWYMKLLWKLKNGEVLFIAKTGYDDVCFFMYDPVHHRSKVAKFHHHLGARTGIHTYVESLVALR
ncbi:F-box protein CPR1-like [Papaver somniferum]|uniref:F-box protein CPR1-like n=1 Tax=Papaver somniferum TaxID=3469 RepID=UPI000E6FD809|nr:F-box protein CPR1-like [Papaver somniferum]